MGLLLAEVEFRGPAGRLEGVLHHDPEAVPQRLAVVCHPHPLYGGTLHNKVTFRAAEALTELGMATLRFNFRGVNRSEGTHDGGRGEQEDLRAALDFLADRFGRQPILVAGFSFGAAVTLRAAPGEGAVDALVAIAPPVRGFDYPELAGCRKPKAVVQGTADTVCPPAELAAAWPGWPEPRRLIEVDGATHFFDGRLGQLKAAVAEAAVWATRPQESRT
ncbi:MAG TPA: alpha/beta fold hydrolase [Candidatus Saccharimonadales bacterium]|nr:alpha/beta fold hydrolase [Candidatus Saccharimonadales bacterium]